MSAYERLEPSFAELDSGDEHLHHIFQDEFEPEIESPKRKIPFLIISSLLLVGLAGGGIAIAYKQGVREGNRSAPPVIKSSSKPLKVKPKQPGGIIIPNQNTLVYDRLDGKPAKITERLMPAPEDVMDLPTKPIQNRMPNAETRMTPENAGQPSGPQPEVRNSRVVVLSAPPADPADSTPLRSREVETFTITPQGVYRNSAPPVPEIVRKRVVASAPPVAMPMAPPEPVAMPAPEVKPETMIPPASVPSPGLAPVISEIRPGNNQEADLPAATIPAPAPAMGGMVSAPKTDAGSAIKETIMMPGSSVPPADAAFPPLPRPNPLRERKIASLEQPKPVQAARPKTVDVTPVPVTAQGRYVVQIASHRKQVDALSEFTSLKRRHPRAVGDYQPLIQKADLGERGIYYRLRIGPLASRADAVKLCSSLKAAGKTDCLIRRR